MVVILLIDSDLVSCYLATVGLFVKGFCKWPARPTLCEAKQAGWGVPGGVKITLFGGDGEGS